MYTVYSYIVHPHVATKTPYGLRAICARCLCTFSPKNTFAQPTQTQMQFNTLVEWRTFGTGPSCQKTYERERASKYTKYLYTRVCLLYLVCMSSFSDAECLSIRFPTCTIYFICQICQYVCFCCVVYANIGLSFRTVHYYICIYITFS